MHTIDDLEERDAGKKGKALGDLSPENEKRLSLIRPTLEPFEGQQAISCFSFCLMLQLF